MTCTHYHERVESDGNVYCDSCEKWIRNDAHPNSFDPTAPDGTDIADHTECDYCGVIGCSVNNHPEALSDMRAWEKEKHREEFPFGDFHPED